MPSPRSLEAQIADLIDRVARLERQVDLRRKRNQQAKLMLATGGVKVSASRGLCANRHVETDPASQEWPAGETVVTTIDPGAEYFSFLPLWWTLPAAQGNVQSVIRFGFSDASSVDRRNTTGSDVIDNHPADAQFFKDGVTCTQIQFIADNVGAPETQDLGAFKFQGWQF